MRNVLSETRSSVRLPLLNGPVMRVIFVGSPGCGKGTQAKLLSEQRHLEHIATGDILRDAKRQGTPAGNRARPYIESGQLVPDDLVNDLIAERFSGEEFQIRLPASVVPDRQFVLAQMLELDLIKMIASAFLT